MQQCISAVCEVFIVVIQQFIDVWTFFTDVIQGCIGVWKAFTAAGQQFTGVCDVFSAVYWCLEIFIAVIKR